MCVATQSLPLHTTSASSRPAGTSLACQRHAVTSLWQERRRRRRRRHGSRLSDHTHTQTHRHKHTHTHINLQPWPRMPKPSTSKEKCQGYSKTGFLLTEESLSHTGETGSLCHLHPLKTGFRLRARRMKNGGILHARCRVSDKDSF